ncbi:hypothetical protein NIES21_57640 (plasmid) [Anabaenopsis circularis NIES-21]|uniref:Uncharacterized protein n=1 Tax=Anabaenopsis circularis NIES-21 TaxID=1085406 RepID=A0A1Z4GQW2_9CYAN|nr:hypothetical protein NIES21_57640 [Anabaenopsis circularis NIES-21]
MEPNQAEQTPGMIQQVTNRDLISSLGISQSEVW